MSSDYLTSVKTQLNYYKTLAEKTFDQLSDEHMSWQYNPESNSIVTIVKHMSGNMLSRWTDFLTTDGEKEWRRRDEEFENDIKGKEEVIKLWNKGWDCVFNALDSLTPEDFTKEVYIRNEAYTVVDAINRQFAHYPYHIGQIVYIGKMICNEQWKSLSVPRGKSKDLNADMFAKPKHKKDYSSKPFVRKKN